MTTHSTLPAILLASIFFLYAPLSSFAQKADPSENQRTKIDQMTKSLNAGLEAAEAENSSQAYSQLERALQLARETEKSKAEDQILGFLSDVSKQLGNKALENENWSGATIHFEKGVEHAENDAYMHYGRGFALAEMGVETGDSERIENGVAVLQRAIEVGNQTGNSRVVELAKDRIEEFETRLQKVQAKVDHIESVREKGYGIALTRQTFDRSSADGISVGIGLVNTSEGKTVKYAKITWKLFNSVGDQTPGDNSGDEVEQTRLVGPLKPGESSYTEFENVWYNSVGTCAQIQRIEVEYIDGSSFTFIDDLSEIASETGGVRIEGDCGYEAQQERKN